MGLPTFGIGFLTSINRINSLPDNALRASLDSIKWMILAITEDSFTQGRGIGVWGILESSNPSLFKVPDMASVPWPGGVGLVATLTALLGLPSAQDSSVLPISQSFHSSVFMVGFLGPDPGY